MPSNNLEGSEDVTDYIAAMTAERAEMAREIDQPVLAYLLATGGRRGQRGPRLGRIAENPPVNETGEDA